MDGTRLTAAVMTTNKRKLPYKGEGSPVRDSINVLDCVFGCAWFPSFEALARHMHSHTDPVTVPRRFRSRQEKREALERIDSPMPAKRKSASRPAPAARSSRGGLPKPSSEGVSSSPFIKASDIGRREGSSATLRIDGKNARIVDGNYGEQLIIDATLNGKNYAWGITLESVNYRLLFERFGANPKNWRGSVKVSTKMSRQNNLYIAVAN